MHELIHRLLHGTLCAAPFIAFPVLWGASGAKYRHVRVIVPPRDWEKEGWA